MLKLKLRSNQYDVEDQVLDNEGDESEMIPQEDPTSITGVDKHKANIIHQVSDINNYKMLTQKKASCSISWAKGFLPQSSEPKVLVYWVDLVTSNPVPKKQPSAGLLPIKEKRNSTRIEELTSRHKSVEEESTKPVLQSSL